MITYKNSETELYMESENRKEAEVLEVLYRLIKDKSDLSVGYAFDLNNSTLRICQTEKE